MASRNLAYRRLRRRGVPDFMGRARTLAHPRRERREAWPTGFFANEMAGGVLPVVKTQQGTFWCWAAVLQGLLALDGKARTQQDITSRHTGKQCPITTTGTNTGQDCTASTGCQLPCDGPHSLLLAMQGWAYQPTRIRGDDAALLAKLKTALAARPVAARIASMAYGVGHSILLTRLTGSGTNPMIDFLSPVFFEGVPYPVRSETVAFSSLTGGFWHAGSEARLSHIYPGS